MITNINIYAFLFGYMHVVSAWSGPMAFEDVSFLTCYGKVT